MMGADSEGLDGGVDGSGSGISSSQRQLLTHIHSETAAALEDGELRRDGFIERAVERVRAERLSLRDQDEMISLRVEPDRGAVDGWKIGECRPEIDGELVHEINDGVVFRFDPVATDEEIVQKMKLDVEQLLDGS